MSYWLIRPKPFESDEQNVSIRETENSHTTKDKSDASKNDDFPTIIVNSEIKKAITAADPKQPERPFPKDLLRSDHSFSTNFQHFVTPLGLKLPGYRSYYS